MMDIRELRVGNVVFAGKNTEFPMYITGIFADNNDLSQGTLYLDFDGNEGDVWEVDTKDEEQVCYMPLTDELLKLNGLSKACFEGRFSFSNKEFGKKVRLMYVHELQNAYFQINKQELELVLG